jgi:hypothetical protein
MDARRALVTFASPSPDPPDTDYVTYWRPYSQASSHPAALGSSGAARHARHVRIAASAYTPEMLASEWRENSAAAIGLPGPAPIRRWPPRATRCPRSGRDALEVSLFAQCSCPSLPRPACRWSGITRCAGRHIGGLRPPASKLLRSTKRVPVGAVPAGSPPSRCGDAVRAGAGVAIDTRSALRGFGGQDLCARRWP